jgi:hypothetical protein
MTLLIFFAILAIFTMPQLAALAMLASVPIAFLLGISAWNDYSSPVPLGDALYLSWAFWVIEIVGLVSFLFIVASILDSVRKG